MCTTIVLCGYIYSWPGKDFRKIRELLCVIFLVLVYKLCILQGGQMIILGKASNTQVEREFEDLANLVGNLSIE